MRPRVNGELLTFAGLVVGGVALAAIWRLLTPATAHLGDEQEASAAVDGTLALLGALAGLITAALVLLRPGPKPARRSAVAIAGSIVAGAVSWQLGDLLGTPALGAVGAAFIWPVATAAALFVGAMLPGTSGRLNNAMPKPPPVFEFRGGFSDEYDGYGDDLRPGERPGPSAPQ